LFENFSGYVDFLLLQDLVSDDCADVTFFLPFDDSRTAAVPKDDVTNREHRRRSIEFIEAQNRRIERHAASPC
jgi:phytoene/squalene synthetase